MVEEVKVREGYKKTEVGFIPEDWEYGKFEDVLKGFSSGATPRRNKPEYYKNGNIKWVNSSELNYNIIIDTSQKITLEGKEKTSLKLLPIGTFLMAITGLEAAGTRGSCAILGTEATTNQSCMALFGTNKMITEYLYHYYTFKGNDLAFEYCQGTKQQSYTAKIVKILPIIYPQDIEEQKLIAKALTDTDNLIQSIEKLINKKEKIKQGAMQELLTGKKRLDGFSGEWGVKELNQLAELTSSKRIFLSDYVKSGIPFYRGKEIKELNMGLDIKDLLYISKDKYKLIKRSYGIPLYGDILISAVGSLGNIFRVQNSKPFYFKDGNLIWLKNIKVDSLWLKYLLEFYNHKLLDTAIGSSQKALTMTSLSKIEFSIPSLQEQKAIAQILSEMDKEIDALKEKLSKYKTIKQGMMQELLTGRIRLI